MQFNQEIEETKGVTETAFKGFPGAVRHFLGVTNAGEHGKNGLNEHANVPFPALADA